MLARFSVSAAAAAPSATPDAGGGTVTPTFTNVYTTIMANGNTCTAHHPTSGNMDLSTQAKAYASIVGTASMGPACGSKMETRIVASNSTGSLLYNKVNGSQDCGGQMPLGETPLSAAQIALIKAWINHGALNN